MSLATFKQQIIKTIDASNACYPDQYVAHKAAGTVSIRRTFFYKYGGSAENWAAVVMSALAPIAEVVDCGEVWREWPATSYFTVTVKPITTKGI